MISSPWSQLIASFLVWKHAAGYPTTTVYSRRQHLEHLARRVKGDPIDVTTDMLLEYMAAQTWAAETRRGRRQTFILFWQWAVEHEHLEHDIAQQLPRVTAATPAPRPCPDSAYLRALAAARPRERLMLRLSAEIGLRRAEVARVHARDLIDDLGGWTLIVHGKGGRERLLPLPAGIAHELHEHTAGGFAFPGANDGHLSPRWVGRLVGRLLPEGITMHTLRHRFASRAWAGGVDVFVLQDILGHASPATTRRYVAVPPTAARAALESMARAA